MNNFLFLLIEVITCTSPLKQLTLSHTYALLFFESPGHLEVHMYIFE